MRSRTSHSRMLACLLQLGVAAVVLSGCAWTARAQNGAPAGTAVPATFQLAASRGHAALLNEVIAVNLDGVSLADAISRIAAACGRSVIFSADDLPPDRHVSLHASRITIADALRTILRATGLAVFVGQDGSIAVAREPEVRNRARSLAVGRITGIIKDSATDEPVSSATILVLGTKQAAVSAATGAFSIDRVDAGSHDLLVRRVGYKEARRVGVLVPADSTVNVVIQLVASPAILDRVLVTATKSPVSVGDVPALTNTIADEDIERRGDTKLTQALATVPGLINSALEGSFESVMLRGMPRTGNEWTTTLLLIDGVPQTDSRNSARVINLPINDVQTIEVVRGPNSALYGRTAIGGVVNILTADPTADPEVNFQLQGGQFDFFRAKGSASGPVGQWGGYYVSAAGGQNHGFHKDSYSLRNRDNDVYAKFTFSPDSKSSGMVSVNDVISDNGVPAPLPVLDGRLLSSVDPKVDLLTNFNIPSSNYHQEEFRSTLNYERRFTDRLTATEVFGFRRIQYKFVDDGDVLGAPFDTAQHLFTMYPFDEETNENIYYEDARLSFRPAIGHIDNTLLIGASYDYTSGFSAGHLIYTDTSTFGWPLDYENPVIPDRSTWQFAPFGGNRYTFGILGLYAQYTIQPLPRLLLLAGGRYDRARLANTKSFNPDQPHTANRFDAFSPKLSTTVKLVVPDSMGPSPGLALNAYATYSGAFLPPRTPSSLSPNDTTVLNPEHVKNYEAGLKGDFGGGMVSFDLAYFHMLRDGIVVDTRQGPFYIPSNAGKQKFSGVETSAAWRPRASLSVYGNAAFYHHRFDHFVIQSSSGDIVLTGNRLPISPDLILNGGAAWNGPRGFGLTINVKHVGDAFLDQGNTYLLPAYTVTDASASWSAGPALITLSAHNLFDKQYFTMGDIELAESIDVAATRQIVLSTSFRLK